MLLHLTNSNWRRPLTCRGHQPSVFNQAAVVQRPLDGRVELWCVFPDEIRDSQLLKCYRRMLTRDERLRGEAFHFERDRHSHLVTRALVRTVLTKYVSIAPADWRFTVNAYGRPEIGNVDPVARRIRFNIAHTDGLILLAVTAHRAIGVDAENITRIPVLEIAGRYFAAQEIAVLKALSSQQQCERFFDFWTLKESYIKARGMGLSIPLDGFAFRLRERAIEFSTDPSIEDDQARWCFWQFRFGQQHTAALCVERLMQDVLDVHVFKTIPLRHEETLECAPLRISA